LSIPLKIHIAIDFVVTVRRIPASASGRCTWQHSHVLQMAKKHITPPMDPPADMWLPPPTLFQNRYSYPASIFELKDKT